VQEAAHDAYVGRSEDRHLAVRPQPRVACIPPATDLQHAAVLQQGARPDRLLLERAIKAFDRTLIPYEVCDAGQAADPDCCCCCSTSAPAAAGQVSRLQDASEAVERDRSCLIGCLHAWGDLGLPDQLYYCCQAGFRPMGWRALLLCWHGLNVLWNGCWWVVTATCKAPQIVFKKLPKQSRYKPPTYQERIPEFVCPYPWVAGPDLSLLPSHASDTSSQIALRVSPCIAQLTSCF
jgi:hypothetical protein